jgi:hypothetical protein
VQVLYYVQVQVVLLVLEYVGGASSVLRTCIVLVLYVLVSEEEIGTPDRHLHAEITIGISVLLQPGSSCKQDRHIKIKYTLYYQLPMRGCYE